MKKVMVIEKYKPGCVDEIYNRFNTHGRLLPQGLEFIDSWITDDLNQCFQLMKTNNEHLVDEWIEQWKDLVDFEVHWVINTQEASQRTNG